MNFTSRTPNYGLNQQVEKQTEVFYTVQFYRLSDNTLANIGKHNNDFIIVPSNSLIDEKDLSKAVEACYLKFAVAHIVIKRYTKS